MTELQTPALAPARATLEIMERLLMSLVREGPAVVAPETGGLSLLCGSTSLFLPVRRFYSMRRFDLGGWPRLGAGGPSVESLAELFDLLHPGLDQARRQRLLGELENSQDNCESSLLAKQELGQGEPGRGSLADWEGRVWLGHPLHPGARLRSGVAKADQRRFGPEWLPRLELPVLEIPREDLVLNGEWERLLARPYPLLCQEGYLGVPVHPWAAEHDLPRRFVAQLDSGRWRFSSHPPIQARPTCSFRTVILEGTDLHLKLPVAVQTTGAVRTVSVSAAHNGPLMTRFLEELWSQEPCREPLRGLHLMGEPASLRLADHGDNNRFLAGLLRHGPGAHRDGQRWLLPGAALLEPRPNPLFLRAAEYYAVTPLDLWALYARTLIPPVAYLCGRLGVALEAHPQNIVVDFRGPAGKTPGLHFHYRDLGGVRLHSGMLERGLEEIALKLQPPTLLPGSATATESLRDLASKFIYSLLQNHLGELSRAIVRSTGEPEALYWNVVRETLEEHRAVLGEELARRIFATDWDLKSMWRMRIDAAVTEYTYAPVANPWSQPA